MLSVTEADLVASPQCAGYVICDKSLGFHGIEGKETHYSGC